MVEGTAYLVRNLPDNALRNLYYWYYGTQVMHNQPGPEWDSWNRKMRRILVDTQCTTDCAAGSWDPQKPSPDPWAGQGGRLMTTSLAALTLEVYYRHLPLYQLVSAEEKEQIDELSVGAHPLHSSARHNTTVGCFVILRGCDFL